MKRDVHEYVKTCGLCQMNKGEQVPTPGLLQPIPIPDGAWQGISMDFIYWPSPHSGRM
jgi:hypothetical protein